jgi:tRNA isopentenyl-2-thiomethyl-A-37 hydroxylase MiaE
MLNEQIRHIVYGDGKVIGQKADILSIQFSKQYGVKKFVYPDAFEKFLKPSDPGIIVTVLNDFRDKKAQIEKEELRMQNEFAEAMKNRQLEKSKLSRSKKKTSSKSKAQKI